MDKIIRSISTVAGAVASWLWGGANGLLYALLVACIMDYITGVFAAGVKHTLSSSIGFKGIAGKATIFILVGFVHVMDRELLGHTAYYGIPRDAVICFYLANEGLSILENAVAIGIPIPENVKSLLLKLKDNSNTMKLTEKESGVKISHVKSKSI